MSLCLGVIKGVAVSSLGLYAGILSTSTLLSFNKSTSIILSHIDDVIIKVQLNNLINRLFQMGNIIGTISTTFFGFSYFGAPSIWRHPYLLYGMLTTPLSSLYLYLTKRAIENKLKLQSSTTKHETANDSKPINISSDSDQENSIVDLGKNNDVATKKEDEASLSYQNSKQFCHSIGKRLLFATIISMVGLTQSILGLYGEGTLI